MVPGTEGDPVWACMHPTVEEPGPAEVVEPWPDVPDVAVQDVPADPGEVAETCGGQVSGTCADKALSCHCCPVGGISPTENCLCSTTCQSDANCLDPARPKCKQVAPGYAGFCAPEMFDCCWTCA